MQQIIMTVGLPASGKSTWAKKWVLEKPGERKRINRDDLRAMLDAGTWSPDNEQYIIGVRDAMVLQALRKGKSVVIDDTNLRADNFKKLCDVIRGSGLSAVVMEKPFPIELQDAIDRDRGRDPRMGGSGMVGEKVITDMWKKYIGKHGKLKDPRTETITGSVKPGEPVAWIDGLPEVILCDLDGTLALMGDRSPYDASRCDELDKPNWPVIECVKAMYAKGVKVIFFSAREDKDREPTERFINKWVTSEVKWTEAVYDGSTASANVTGRVEMTAMKQIPYELFMRPTGDQRNDGIMKELMFNEHIRGKYNVRFILDDRDRVVNKWREMGLTCFQVNPGNF